MSAPRLALGTGAVGRDRLDGGWWPRSRHLGSELADLIRAFPSEHGSVVRGRFSPPDWDDAPEWVAVPGRSIKVGAIPDDDTSVVHLTMADGAVYCLLVVPPAFDEAQGAEALLAASTSGNRHSAGDLLDTVTDQLAVDHTRLWDAGGIS